MSIHGSSMTVPTARTRDILVGRYILKISQKLRSQRKDFKAGFKIYKFEVG
jgi:hypothetical protein